MMFHIPEYTSIDYQPSWDSSSKPESQCGEAKAIEVAKLYSYCECHFCVIVFGHNEADDTALLITIVNYYQLPNCEQFRMLLNEYVDCLKLLASLDFVRRCETN